MIVVHSSVAAVLMLRSTHNSAAERVVSKDSRWAAPLLWRSEFESILAHGIRTGRLSVSAAGRMMDKAAKLYRGREYAVPPNDVLTLANSCSCPAQACEYAVLAYALEAPLLTADEAMIPAFPDIAVRPAEFA
jgi:predicted nucleic acid-binding protein